MKFFFDVFPVVLFFIVYKFFGIYAATIAAIVTALIQVGYYWLKHRSFDRMQIAMLVLITIFGSLTLFFHNEIFIKWKPTVINWLLAVVFLGSQFIGRKPLIQQMMESNVSLPSQMWVRLNLSWIIFFVVMGLINLYVAYNFDTDTWVNFKLFGMLGLTLAFAVLQAIFLAKHMSNHNFPKST